MRANLERECARIAERAHSLRIRDFRYSLAGDVVTLEGEAAHPDAIDSVGQLFAGAAVREVRNLVRFAPEDPEVPGACHSPKGYVHVVELGPHATRLVETNTWEVQAGDTLDSIAERVYGSVEKAAVLRAANAGQLGPGGFVRPGQRLKVPPR